MKDLVIALLATALLILLFSTGHLPENLTPLSGGSGPQYPGDSGMVLPGNGAEPAEVNVPGSQQAAERATECATEGENVSSVAREAIFTETIKEEQDSMNEVMEAFWSGAAVSAAAILVGEAAALLVAAAWMKIRRNDHEI